MVIVGNKVDLITNTYTAKKNLEKFADECGAEFELVSALDGSGINELFTKVIQKYDNKQKLKNEKEEREAENNVKLENETKEDKGKSKKKKCCQK
ncbi:MAG: hypothetical protein MJ252_18540 [archaeon]|nr:hypothetical protein [archaeon]